MNNTKILFYTLIIIVGFQFQIHAQSDYLTKKWSKTSLGTSLGQANIWCDDFDGDGFQEVLYSGEPGNNQSYFALLSYKNGDYHTKWSSDIYAGNKIKSIQKANLDNDNDIEIYIVTNDGQVDVYSGETMSLIHSQSTTSLGSSQSYITDTDGDGNYEFIIVRDYYGQQYLHIYDAITLQPIFQTDQYGGKDIAVGDIDGDGTNEIVLSKGYVLDGEDYSLKWQYEDDFGDWVGIADVNGDEISDIICAEATTGIISSIDGVLHTVQWQIETGYWDIEDMIVNDVEQDGLYEIVIGVNNFSVAIACYDATTQQKLWENINVNDEITSIGVGDADNDGVDEFIWGSFEDFSDSYHLYVGGFDTHETEWRSKDIVGGFFADIFDLDNNDTLDILCAASKTRSEYKYGAIFTYNGINYELENILEPAYWCRVYCIAAGNINDNVRGEIVIGMEENIFVYDGFTYNQLWQSEEMYTPQDIELIDLDNDNIVEIVVVDIQGYITIINGETFEIEWKSEYTGGRIEKVIIENLDDDDAKEIIINKLNGDIQIYDGITHSLQWESDNLGNVVTFDIFDHNDNDIMDIISVDTYGRVSITNCEDFSSFQAFTIPDDNIYSIEIDNIDSTTSKEIIIGVSWSLKVYSVADYSLIWESNYLGGLVGRYNNIKIADLNNNQHKEIIYTTGWGVFQFESSSRCIDNIPPQVVRNSPLQMQNVGNNIKINIAFSELISGPTLNDNTISVVSQSGDNLDKAISYGTNNILTIIPDNNLPPNNEIRILLSGLICDTAGNGLDGNFNGISEGSQIDDFEWSFTTGSGEDLIGPTFTNLIPDSYVKWKGNSLYINGVISDNSDIAMSPIVAAEYFIDNIGASGTGKAMISSDGQLDESTEEVYLKIACDELSYGDHILFFHAQDAIGNWGEMSELTISISTEEEGCWTMFGNNPQHTGIAKDNISVPLKLLWSKDFDNEVVNPVCVVNNEVVVTTGGHGNDKGVYVLNKETGEEKWRRQYSELFSLNPPSFAYGNIYFQTCNGVGDSYIHALDITTGNVSWVSPYGSQWESHFAPTIINGRVYVNGGQYGGVYSFDAFSGKQYWFQNLPQDDGWTPALYNDTLYAYTSYSNSDFGYFAAFNALYGNRAWVNYDVPNGWSGHAMNTAPVIDTVNKIIMASAKWDQSAIDMVNHEVLWSHTGYFVNPAVANSMIYSANADQLEARDIRTGDLLWSINIDGDIAYPPLVTDDLVFVSAQNEVYAIDIADHMIKWSYNVGGHLTISQNELYVAGEDKKLYAFEIPAGIDDFGFDDKFILQQNYPNPVIGTNITTIDYSLPRNAWVELSILDIRGLEITMLENGRKPKGNNSVIYNTTGLKPGVYLYKLTVDVTQSEIRKMIVIEK